MLEYALLQPLVVRPYQDPHTVAACWQRWSREPKATDTLFAIGRRRDEVPPENQGAGVGSPIVARMGRPMVCERGSPSSGHPFFDCGKSSEAAVFDLLTCDAGLGDRTLLAYSVLEVADGVYAQRTSMWPGRADADAGGNYSTYLEGIRGAPAGALPTLALSGGAANGAFQAGFLFRLLSIREQAMASSPAAAREIQARERFGAIVSTSVGSLIAPLLDSYFDDVRRAGDAGPPIDPGAFTRCVGAQVLEDEKQLPSRAAQGCALRLLRSSFTQTHDWHLLCVEKASLRQLLGVNTPDHPVANALAFDPMRDVVLAPFYADFGDRLVTNELPIEQMSVDVEQRVVLPLDERVCGELEKCGRGLRRTCYLNFCR